MHLLISLLLFGALLLRLLTAHGTGLNPDEALVFLVSNQKTLAEVYRLSLFQPHPPLAFFLLYFWRHLGTSELILRLPSVLAGTAGIYFFFRALEARFGRPLALSGALLFGFLPPLVGLSAEVRQYALMLLFISLALHFTEIGLKGDRPGPLLLGGLFSALAGVTQYSAVLLLPALGVYTLLRARRRKTLFSALAGLAGVGAVYLLLYFTHITRLKGTPMQEFAVNQWLAPSFFHPERENPLIFTARTTFELFKYLFGSPHLGALGVGLFTLGVLRLLVRKRLDLVFLATLPFVFGLSAALLRISPYGGTRHSIFLAPPALLGITAGLGTVRVRRALWLNPAVAGILALLSNIFLLSPGQHIPRPDARRQLFNRALAFLKENAPPGDTIFTDYQGCVLLSYYLADHRRPVPALGKEKGIFWEFNYGGYLVVCTKEWDFFRFSDPWVVVESLYATYRFSPARTVWTFDGGWGRLLGPPELRFGRNLAVFPLTAPTPLETLLIQATERLEGLHPDRVRTVLLPGACLSENLLKACARLGENVLSYRELYQKVRGSDEIFERFLPALAFWVFSDTTRHPRLFAFMAEAQSYIAAGYRFTLLVMDPGHRVAVYRIEKNR